MIRVAKDRPVAFLCGIYMIMSFVSAFLFGTALFYVLFSAAIAIIIVLFLKADGENKRTERVFLIFSVLAIIIPLIVSCVRELYVIPESRTFVKSDEVEFTGTVLDLDVKDNYYTFTVKLIECDGRKTDLKVRVESRSELSGTFAALRPGDVIASKALFTAIAPSSRYDRYYRSENVYLIAEPSELKIVDTNRLSFNYLFYELRDYLKYNSYYFKNSAFVRALMFGDSSSLDRDYVDTLNSLGISHFLAISGLHLSVISGSVFYLLKRRKTSKRAKSAILYCICFFYMALCSFSPSIVRSAIMIILSDLASNFRRDPDAPTSLFISATVLISFNPNIVYDVGFQLSFLSTAGISIGAAKYIQYLHSFKFFDSKETNCKTLSAIILYFIEPMIITVSAILFSSPALMMNFRHINMFSMIVNIPLMVIFAPMLYFLLLAMIFYTVGDVIFFLDPLFTWVADFFRDGTDILADAFKWIAELCYRIFGKGTFVYENVAAAVSLLTFALIFLYIFKQVKVKFYPIVPILWTLSTFLGVFVSSVLYFDVLTVFSVSDRTDEKIMLRYNDTVLIGEIETKGYHTTKHTIKSFVETNGLESVDGYFFAKYSENIPEQIKLLNKVISIENVYLPHPESDEEKGIFLQVARACGEEGIDISEYSKGYLIDCGNIVVNVTELKNLNGEGKNEYDISFFASEGARVTYSSCVECEDCDHDYGDDVCIHLEGAPSNEKALSDDCFVVYSDDMAHLDLYDRRFVRIDKDTKGFVINIKKSDAKTNYKIIEKVY